MTKKVDEKTAIHYPCARPGLVVKPTGTSAAHKAARARQAKTWARPLVSTGSVWGAGTK